jgi:hypothetical protein
MKSHLFTFIIAYKHRNDRIHNLRRVLDWVSGFGGVEIIIVEQDDAPRLPSFTIKGIKHIFTKSEMPFNKAWAFNVGLKYATTETIVVEHLHYHTDTRNVQYPLETWVMHGRLHALETCSTAYAGLDD